MPNLLLLPFTCFRQALIELAHIELPNPIKRSFLDLTLLQTGVTKRFGFGDEIT